MIAVDGQIYRLVNLDRIRMHNAVEQIIEALEKAGQFDEV